MSSNNGKGEQVRGSWKTAMGYVYLSSEEMEIGVVRNLTITEVTKEMAYDKQTKEEKPLVSVWFEETERALGLNATNAKAITEIAGTTTCTRWAGVKVGLTNSGETFFGKVGALRVVRPVEKPSEAAPPTEVAAS